MLHFLVTSDHSYTMRDYFLHWGAALASQVRILGYETMPWTREPLPGAWIFTDLERLRPAEFESACSFAQRLSADPARWKVLNEPRKVLLRHALMRDLHAAGINDFRAFRLSDLPDDLRYPLFLRGENDHDGAATDLLHDAGQLRSAQGRLRNPEGMLAVEYLPYEREDGLFIKYSMMRIGEDLVPRHKFFSRHWVLKDPNLLDEPLMQEEDQYVNHPPHSQAIQDVFQRSGIDYGRIDYTVVNGRIQVFEINTNPVVLRGIRKLAPRRWSSQAVSARLINDALARLAAGLPEANPVRARAEVRTQHLRWQVHRVLRKLRLGPRRRR